MNEENKEKINGGNTVRGKLGPGEIITAEYTGGVLRLWFPKELWTYGYGTLVQTASMGGAKPKYGYICKGTAEWIFKLAFEWMREFPGEEMAEILETNTSCLAYTSKLLEASGLCIVDKQKHFQNKYSMHKGSGYYEWTALMPASFTSSSESDDHFDYFIDGTMFGGMFEKYLECEGLDEYIPEKQPGWGRLGKWVYESPYYDLTYRFSGTTFKSRLYECWWVHIAASKFGVPPVYKNRLYNGFHYMPSVLRKNIYYKGDSITELFDLHCSFYTISAGVILEKFPDVDRQAVERFYWDCVMGNLYDKCSEYIHAPREVAKEKLQGWRNLTNRGAAHSPKYNYVQVSEFMERTYPEIADIYYEWPLYENERGEKKKALQRDLSDYETRLMSKLAFEIENKYNVKCLLLHDAIYVSVKDKEKMPADIEKRIFNWFENNILH